MANAYTDFATLQLAGRTDESQSPNLKQYGGNVKHIDVKISDYTAATSTPLYLARLPAGARLLTNLCSVDYGDPGDALAGSIGYYTANTDTPALVDVDYFGTALALGSAAGRKNFTEAGTIGDALLTPVQFTTDVWIVVTWTTATNAVSHAQNWHLVYTLA